MTPAASNDGAPWPDTEGWHSPPPRAVRLHMLTTAGLAAVIAAAVMAAPLLAADEWGLAGKGAGGAAVLLLAALGGAWTGARLRHQRWLLDEEGLWLRTGRQWWRETRVPASRVQHVDLKHGPLERRARLATLVVHTAAAHLGGITVRGLDEDEARLLRDQLARQLDEAGDAL